MRQVIAIVGVVLVAGCSSSGSSGAGTDTEGSTISNIEDLPMATSPVSEAASASLNTLRSGRQLFATTGLAFQLDDAASHFTDESSYAACETYNHAQQALRNAAQGDMILCFLQSMFSRADELGLDGIDIYDGEYHVIGMDVSGMPEESDLSSAPDKVRLRVVRDENNVITNFEMQSCNSSSQNEYLQQTIDPSTGEFTMVGKVINDERRQEIEVAATIGSDGTFVGTKNITQLFSEESGYGGINFAQTSDELTADGAMSFTYSYDGSDFRSVSQVQSAAQLLDFNVEGESYDLGLLALGDGAVKYLYTNYDESDNELWVDGAIEGWNGETLLVDEVVSADYITTVQDAEFSTASEPTIEYASGEDYDCADEAEATIVMADAADGLVSECSGVMNSDHSWLDCWNTINPGQEGDGEDF